MTVGQRVALGVRLLVIFVVGWVGLMVTVLARDGRELAAGLSIVTAVALLVFATFTASRRSHPRGQMFAAAVALVLAGVFAGLVFASLEPSFLADVLAAGLVPVVSGVLIAVSAVLEPQTRPRASRVS